MTDDYTARLELETKNALDAALDPNVLLARFWTVFRAVPGAEPPHARRGTDSYCVPMLVG